MQQTFRLVIEYDGTDYHGWQRQNDVRTVQETIEAALERITCQSPAVTASGRTDRGVHAQNQVAHFSVETGLSPQMLRKGLNALTPEDIVIKECQPVPDTFHARRGVSSKIYDYHIFNHHMPTALFRRYSWHIRKKLDLDAMRQGMAYLHGTHDFSAFEAAGSDRSHPVRTIFDAEIVSKEEGKHVILSLEGNGFLRCMVRNIVGTLIEVGLGKRTAQNVHEVLKSLDRSKAGETAPPRGLFLRSVKYDTESHPDPLTLFLALG